MRRNESVNVDSGTHAGSHVPVAVLRSILAVRKLAPRPAIESQCKGKDENDKTTTCPDEIYCTFHISVRPCMLIPSSLVAVSPLATQ